MALLDSIRMSTLGFVLMTFVVLAATYWSSGSFGDFSPEPAKTISLKKLLVASVEMAKLGGVEVKAVRKQTDLGEKSKGGEKNSVTEGDLRSHRVMFYGLKKTFPGLNVVSEEDDQSPVEMSEINQAKLTDPDVDDLISEVEDVVVPMEDVDVWVDPLDATQEYTENLLNYVTTMVCVAIRGKPTIGVIYKPFEDTTAWGWVGPNLHSRAIQMGMSNLENNDASHTRLIVSRSHAGGVHDVASKAFGNKVKVTPAGGAGFKSWEVAVGKQDAYIHVTLIKKWDICPGDALLRSIGGQLTTLAGEGIDYSGKPPKVKNMGGVLATMHNHPLFVEKLKDTLVTIK